MPCGRGTKHRSSSETYYKAKDWGPDERYDATERTRCSADRQSEDDARPEQASGGQALRDRTTLAFDRMQDGSSQLSECVAASGEDLRGRRLRGFLPA